MAVPRKWLLARRSKCAVPFLAPSSADIFALTPALWFASLLLNYSCSCCHATCFERLALFLTGLETQTPISSGSSHHRIALTTSQAVPQPANIRQKKAGLHCRGSTDETFRKHASRKILALKYAYIRETRNTTCPQNTAVWQVSGTKADILRTAVVSGVSCRQKRSNAGDPSSRDRSSSPQPQSCLGKQA